jgi:hypothetical protein
MKIVSAANAMISNPGKITSVIPGSTSGELFFLYAEKHKWSIVSTSDGADYSLFYYPTDLSLESLASMEDYQWSDFSYMIRYSSKDIGTKEAKDTFAELYTIVKERLFGVDDVLTEIINTADWSLE